MKRFTLKFIIFILLLGMLIIPFNVLTDPYNVFHAGNIRDNGVEPNKNYIKTKFVLDHKDEYDSYLFGSSRAGFYDVSVLPDGNWYNLSYSEAVPSEQVNTLKALIAGGEIPKQVFLTVPHQHFHLLKMKNLLISFHHKEALLSILYNIFCWNRM